MKEKWRKYEINKEGRVILKRRWWKKKRRKEVKEKKMKDVKEEKGGMKWKKTLIIWKKIWNKKK